MRIIEVRGEHIETKDTWGELTLGDYISMIGLYSNVKEGETINDLDEDVLLEFLINFINLLTGKTVEFLYTLYEDELMLFNDLVNIFNLTTFAPQDNKEYYINDKLYSYALPNKLTVGEKISIKLLEKGSKTESEVWLNILTILFRPATKTEDEFGCPVYTLEEFNGDMNILNKRKELIRNNVKAINALWVIEAFTNGNK